MSLRSTGNWSRFRFQKAARKTAQFPFSKWPPATGSPAKCRACNGATAGGSLAWNADGSGFWYTRYPHEGERPPADLEFFQQVYFHRLGTPSAQDEYAVGKQFPRIAEIALESSRDGKYVLARVANGDGGDFLDYMLLPDGIWHQITRFADRTSQVAFGRDGTLYLLSRKDAPMGKITRARAAFVHDVRGENAADGDALLDRGFPARRIAYLCELHGGGPSKLFDVEPGKPTRPSISRRYRRCGNWWRARRSVVV